MDPANPSSFNHRSELLSTGRRYHFVDQIPSTYDATSTVTLLCVHGFPDLWYGWRYQIGPWVRKGYRVVVPDMLGYGQTDKPAEAAAYSSKRLCDDLAALLDSLDVPKAVIIGHDWGAFTVGRFSMWHPNRLLALVILAVPFMPPSGEYVPLEGIVKKVPNYGYQLYLADPRSTTEIEANLEFFLGLMHRKPHTGAGFTDAGRLRELVVGEKKANLKGSSVLSPAEFAYYMSQYRSMNGPLSYYRTTKYRFEEEKAGGLLRAPRPDLPVMFMGGTEDPTCRPDALGLSKRAIPQLELRWLQGLGHWVMIQAKEEVTEGIAEWLHGVLQRTPQIQLHSAL
ncbi:Bifunctional epoxide hydrolase 2 [Grifola frondosa]|uniref:Bifunctional epoxide hydrolase 2 n=1 Tax=Grifola frondosa TaxID=5627 RepID=A0A1C7M5I8_GRIFR|nr:Bifunctional epoxide hydrolase 2 [Grifola frondosa]